MRNLFLFFLLTRLFGNPLMALLALLLCYVLIDRRFIGLLPDFSRPFRRSARIRQLRETIALNPADATARYELGTLLLEAGKVAAALNLLETAGQRLGDHANAQFSLGAAYVLSGQYAAGEAALRRAVQMRPEVQYGLPYVYLLQATLADGAVAADEAEVASWLDTAARYGNVETCYRLGLVLHRHGRTEEAVRMYKEALAGYRRCPAFARKAARRWAVFAHLRLWQLGRQGTATA
jgi:tetratricopeptide (TPR) repeat protein